MSNVENKCSGCEHNCCSHFKINKELTDPRGLRIELEQYSYIKRIGSELLMGPGGHERVVGVYSCDRFDKETGECIEYSTRPRPPFCINTGVTSKPSSLCKLQ
jgi:Fe-S-cluster containining protein